MSKNYKRQLKLGLAQDGLQLYPYGNSGRQRVNEIRCKPRIPPDGFCFSRQISHVSACLWWVINGTTRHSGSPISVSSAGHDSNCLSTTTTAKLLNPSQNYRVSLAMRDHTACHPTQVNTPHLNPSQWRQVLDLPTPEGWKAELT